MKLSLFTKVVPKFWKISYHAMSEIYYTPRNNGLLPCLFRDSSLDYKSTMFDFIGKRIFLERNSLLDTIL